LNKTKVSFYLRDELNAQIKARGGLTEIIHRDLDRLYSIYDRSLREVSLSLSEAMLIIDAVNGSLYDVTSAHLLWAGVEDAIKLDKLDQKWSVDGQALVNKLRDLNTIHSLAIIDAAERVWHAVSNGDNRDFKEVVKETFGVND
jgi:hypothetical protein